LAIGEEDSKHRGEEEEDTDLGRPIAGSAEISTEPGRGHFVVSSVTPPDGLVSSSRFQVQRPSSLFPLVRDGHGIAKRPRAETRSFVEGEHKRLKSEQASLRETPSASLFTNTLAPPRTADFYFEESHARFSNNELGPSQQRRPSLVGNGSDLTLRHAPQKSPLPSQRGFHPGSLLPDHSTVRPPFIDLGKIRSGVRRSEKYRKSQDLSE
jgi:hypothetical protein